MPTHDRLTQTRARIAQFAAIGTLTFAGLAAHPAVAQSAYIGPSGTVAAPKTGFWNTAANWSPTGVPASASTTSLSFGGSGTSGYGATDDISGAFMLNNLTFNSGSTITNTIATNLGNSLNFVTNGGTAPTVTQSGTGAFNLNIPIALTNNLTFNGTGAGNITSNGIISGSGSLTQSDPNNTLTLGLTQTNSTTTLNSTTVTVTTTNGLTVGEPVAGNGIQAGTTIASITDGTHFVLSAQATATYNGTDAVTFGNTYTGGTTITAGTLSTAIGTIASGGVSAFGTGAITLGDTSGSNNAALSFTGNNQHLFNAINVASGSTGTLSLLAVGSTATVNFDGLITLANNLTIQSNLTTTGGMNINSGGTGNTITGTGNVSIVNNSGTGVIQIKGGAGGFNNTGTITHTGTSTGTDILQAGLGANVTSVTQNSSTSALKLTGTNTPFTGALNVLSGSLLLGGTTSNAAILATVNTGGTLDISGNPITLASLSDGTGGGGTVTNSVASVKVLTLGGSGTASFSGALTGTYLALTKSSTGTQALSGNNSYSGNTLVSGGTLLAANSNALGFGGATPISTTLGNTQVSSTATLDLNNGITVTEPLTLNGTTPGDNLINTAANTTSILNNGVAGLQFTATPTNLSSTSIPTVSLTGGGGTGAAATALLGVTAATFIIAGGTTVYSVAPTVTITGGNGVQATATAVLTAGKVTGITITNPGTGFTGVPTITFSGGTVTTSGTNPTGTGQDGNFTIGGLAMTAAGSGYTTAPTVGLSSGSITATSVLPTVALTGVNNNIGGAGSLTVNDVVTGSGGFTKIGAGTLTLNAANTYTGTTTVSAGTLALNGAHADGTGALTVTGGTVSTGVNGALGGGAVTLTNGTIQNTFLASGGTANDVQTSSNLTITSGVATLDFGAGNTGAKFTFTNALPDNFGGILNIINYTGNPFNPATLEAAAGGGLDQLFFAPGVEHQLQQVYFINPSGNTGTFQARLLTSGEVVAPEPSQWLALGLGALGLGTLALKARRRTLAA